VAVVALELSRGAGPAVDREHRCLARLERGDEATAGRALLCLGRRELLAQARSPAAK
jgi:hypothetical protein